MRAWVAAACVALWAAPGASQDGLGKRPPRREPQRAPSLAGGKAWFNTTKPLTWADLRGKVVLLDFWTFG